MSYWHMWRRGRDTWWVDVDPDVPPVWFGERTGRLEEVIDTMIHWKAV